MNQRVLLNLGLLPETEREVLLKVELNEPIVYTQVAVKETHTVGRNMVLGLSMNL